jgi:hypothetical protein
MFSEMGLIDTYGIKVPILKNFLLAVRAKYNPNPFHNWKHGFAVLHFSWVTLLQTKAAVKCLTTPDVLALLVASLCHDIDHRMHTRNTQHATHNGQHTAWHGAVQLCSCAALTTAVSTPSDVPPLMCACTDCTACTFAAADDDVFVQRATRMRMRSIRRRIRR